MLFSHRVESIPQALSIYINQLVYDLKRRGRDIVTLSLGEAFFDIPLFDFKNLDLDKCYHYSDSQGIPELRQKIASYYQRHYGAPVDGEREVLITAGSKPAIFMAMQAVLDPGQEVVIHEPAWLSYQEQARLINAVPRFIPHDVPVADFINHLTPASRLLILCNPNNPAGRLYTRRELLGLLEELRSRGVWLLVDEAYSDFVCDEKFYSMAEVSHDKQGIIVVNSLSKNMGMSGWRIGYVISHSEMISRLLKINQHLITCAPSILLYYVNRYFEDIITLTLPQVREVVDKRARVAKMMDSIGLKRMAGASTFYFFASIENYPSTSLDFALHLLLEHGIAVVPGSAYGTSTERFVRISIGTESEERIEESLSIMRSLTQTTTFAPSRIRQQLAELGNSYFEGS